MDGRRTNARVDGAPVLDDLDDQGRRNSRPLLSPLQDLRSATSLLEQVVVVAALFGTVYQVVRAIKRAQAGEGRTDVVLAFVLTLPVAMLAIKFGDAQVRLHAATLQREAGAALASWDCSDVERARASLRGGHLILMNARHKLPSVGQAAELIAREHPWDEPLAERGTSRFDEQEQHIYAACAGMRPLLEQVWRLAPNPGEQAP